MPFPTYRKNHDLPSATASLMQSAGALGSIANPNLPRLGAGTTDIDATGHDANTMTSARTDAFASLHDPAAHGIGGHFNTGDHQASGRVGSMDPSSLPASAPVSTVQSEAPFNTPRRNHAHRGSEDLRMRPNNALPIHQQYTPQAYQDSHPSYSTNPPPSFNLHQASPQGSQQPASVVPSNAGIASVPSSLQPGSSHARPAASTAYTLPGTLPTLQSQPLQTNAQQYAHVSSQTPSRTSTLHSHSRSSPAGMDGLSSAGQKYVPFNHTPTQTPASSNPKAYNALSSNNPSSNAHTPLNLSDIRSRTVSDANEPAMMGTNLLYSYADTPTNSNYLAPFAAYAFDWCKWPIQGGGSSAGKMAVGSYLEDPHNFIQILDTQIVPQEVTAAGQSPYGLEYTKVAEATCAYPVTRILWEPPSQAKAGTDLLATSGDHLRLWSLPPATNSVSSNINRSSTASSRDPAPQKLQPLALLSNSKTPEHTAPLTSLDWNRLSPKLIITSSIDTTCTVWDIPTLTAKTQLIAHDKEVFDVRFCAGSVDVFVSCGADGSVRMFDLRSLEHSTIIYEPAEKNDKSASPGASSPSKAGLAPAPPLLRLAASPHDAHLLATFASDSNIIRILDVRQPGTALLELRGHQSSLNSIEWSPHRRGLLASGADDSLVLVWDLLNAQNQAQVPAVNGNGAATPAVAQTKGPHASWRCEYEVANVSWAPESMLTAQGGDWLGVCGGRGVWGLKI